MLLFCVKIGLRQLHVPFTMLSVSLIHLDDELVFHRMHVSHYLVQTIRHRVYQELLGCD